MPGRDIDWGEVTRLAVVWLIVGVAVGFVVGVFIYAVSPWADLNEEIAGAIVASVATVLVGLLKIVNTVLSSDAGDD